MLVLADGGHCGESRREQSGGPGCSSVPMKRNAILVILVISAPLILDAQPQLDNPSFEAWDNAGQATQEPQQWSSLKTSDGGAILNGLVPQLCWRSNDARTGQYSVNLRTVSSVIGAANGLLTNGRVHAELDVANSYMYTIQDNEQWRTAMTSRPDSIVGWFKAAPQTGDRANVGALLHVDDGRLPAFGTEGNYVAGASWKAPLGSVGEWTRFSAPFQYLNDWQPEWILLILTAGDSAGSAVGTQVWYDDLALIYNVACTPSTGVVVVSEFVAGDFDVSYSTGGIPEGPTTFTVELSDASGDFSSPVTIGSVVSALATGVIPCSIPAGTLAGAGYAIRIVTDSPFYAPVGCAVQVELETGISAGSRPAPSIRCTANGLLIDSKDAGRYECFDAQGRAVAIGSLLQGVNTVALDTRGMILVRVMSGAGSWMERVIVH